MKPYKLKHIPTGLYYQPHKHRGSNLSKRGKIYQTGTHGLSSVFRNRQDKEEHEKVFTIYCEKDSLVHKLTKDLLAWKDCRFSYNQVEAITYLKDWEKEEI